MNHELFGNDPSQDSNFLPDAGIPSLDLGPSQYVDMQTSDLDLQRGLPWHDSPYEPFNLEWGAEHDGDFNSDDMLNFNSSDSFYPSSLNTETPFESEQTIPSYSTSPIESELRTLGSRARESFNPTTPGEMVNQEGYYSQLSFHSANTHPITIRYGHDVYDDNDNCIGSLDDDLKIYDSCHDLAGHLSPNNGKIYDSHDHLVGYTDASGKAYTLDGQEIYDGDGNAAKAAAYYLLKYRGGFG